MKLSAAARKKLKKSEFALPGNAPGPGSYPIPDRAHAIAAESYSKRFASPAEREAILRKIRARFPGLNGR